MQCRYCRAWNSHEEHRCTRCGRRMIVASARSIPEAYPIQTATAPELVGDEREEEPVPTGLRPGPSRPVYQRSLFREMQHVVQMPALRPVPRQTTPRSRPVRRVPADQQALDFGASNARAEQDTVIYCDSPVAQPIHRMTAAAFDCSMIVMAIALFGAAFHMAGGPIVVNFQSIPVVVGIGGVLAFFYHLLVAMLGGGRTPGMAWTRLDLLDFDGRRPARSQRMRRLFSGLLSTLAAGLGLLWALVDEEKLTWHDHISRTFLTPRRSWDE